MQNKNTQTNKYLLCFVLHLTGFLYTCSFFCAKSPGHKFLFNSPEDEEHSQR